MGLLIKLPLKGVLEALVDEMGFGISKPTMMSSNVGNQFEGGSSNIPGGSGNSNNPGGGSPNNPGGGSPNNPGSPNNNDNPNNLQGDANNIDLLLDNVNTAEYKMTNRLSGGEEYPYNSRGNMFDQTGNPTTSLTMHEKIAIIRARNYILRGTGGNIREYSFATQVRAYLVLRHRNINDLSLVERVGDVPLAYKGVSNSKQNISLTIGALQDYRSGLLEVGGNNN